MEMIAFVNALLQLLLQSYSSFPLCCSDSIVKVSSITCLITLVCETCFTFALCASFI